LSLGAIVMMTAILVLVWGGFVVALFLATRQERNTVTKETGNGDVAES
jgi:hypothetical protein